MRLIRVSTFAAAFFASLPLHAIAAADSSDDNTVRVASSRTEHIVESDDYVRDANGRIEYIVDIRPTAIAQYPSSLTERSHFHSYEKPQVVNAVRAFEHRYGISATQMTSWSSTSFTANLDESQADALARDPRVVDIVPSEYMEYSYNQLQDSGAVWTDSANAEVRSWGKMAVNSSTTSSAGTSLVYVLDAGVGLHQDLPSNVIEYVNVLDHSFDCGTRVGVGLAACDQNRLQHLIGCYTHGTGVAGVIGAAAANGVGTAGVNPGVRIISVAMPVAADSTGLDAVNQCLLPEPSMTPVPPGGNVGGATTATFRTAIDWVTSDIASHNVGGLTSVVNLSSNWINGDSGASVLKTDMLTLASSSPGALVVQSAGNYYESACLHAYSAVLPADGVMTVGAVNNHGQPVVPLSKDGTVPVSVAEGFWRNSKAFAYAKGSDYGSCVDIWAPGDGIYMPMANPTTATAQKGFVTYSTYGFGSGTSFAAPHVAGLASLIIENLHLTSPSTVENKIRTLYSYSLGSTDHDGVAIKIATANASHPSTASTPYGELVAQYFIINGTGGRVVQSQTVNGFAFSIGTNHDYEQLGNPLVIPSENVGLKFGTTGGACSVTRALQPFGTPLYSIVNNDTSYGSDDVWTGSSGQNTWAIASTCFADGARITTTSP